MWKPLLLAPGPGNPRNSEGAFLLLRDGRLLFVYSHFTGGRDDHASAFLAARHSADGGATWTDTDQIVLPNQGGMNVMSVSLLRLLDGRIALFYLLKNSLADCRPLVRFSTDETRTWSEPIPLVPDGDTGYYVLNNDRVVQLASGRLLAPVALHNRPGWEKPDWLGEVSCLLSDDAGRTWRRSPAWHRAIAPDGTRVSAQEPGVVELADGRIMMLIRTNAGVQYLSFSGDGGESWSKPTPSTLASPQSPASCKRIPGTGDLLLVWNNHAAHPERADQRSPLHTAISRDEGQTWTNPRPVESDPDGWYCYTAIAFAADHLLLSYCTGPRAQALAATQITRLPIPWLYGQ